MHLPKNTRKSKCSFFFCFYFFIFSFFSFPVSLLSG
ncbi:putative membrane protein, partial [Escherichia coli MP021017.12]